jgi:hypothetical protein
LTNSPAQSNHTSPMQCTSHSLLALRRPGSCDAHWASTPAERPKSGNYHHARSANRLSDQDEKQRREKPARAPVRLSCGQQTETETREKLQDPEDGNQPMAPFGHNSVG